MLRAFVDDIVICELKARFPGVGEKATAPALTGSIEYVIGVETVELACPSDVLTHAIASSVNDELEIETVPLSPDNAVPTAHAPSLLHTGSGPFVV
jgi:hypothetical protein